MPWKTDEDGNGVWDNGAPVWVNKQGEEVPYDADREQATLAAANREAQERKQRIQELTGRVEQYEPLSEFLGDDADPATLAKEIRTLRRQIKAAPKDGGLDPELQAKVDRLGELEESLAEEKARAAGVEKRAKQYEDNLTTAQQQLQQLTVGREVRGSKWFAAQNGNSSLSTFPAELAEEKFSPFGRPDPDKPGQVVFYKTREGAEKRDATEVIRDDAGNPAGVDHAIEVLGPTFSWWKDFVRPAGATGSDADNLDPTVTAPAKLTKADLKDTQAKVAYAKKHGVDALNAELKRLLAPSA